MTQKQKGVLKGAALLQNCSSEGDCGALVGNRRLEH